MTPTTAAVIAVSGAVNVSVVVRRFDQRAAGEDEQERRQEREPRHHARASDAGEQARSGPNSAACVQPPTKPTNATTMISGPGVVSPSARPSIICVAAEPAVCSTAP